MQIGFFFWPFDPPLVRQMAASADRYGYDMVGIADTPGNAMDPWVATTYSLTATAGPPAHSDCLLERLAAWRGNAWSGHADQDALG